MRFPFSEKKSTQVAAKFLALHGGKMEFLRLVKLMYLTDRAALFKWNRPLSGDRYVSMREGPTLSKVYDFIKGHPREKADYWDTYIGKRHGHDIDLLREPDYGELSENEIELISHVHEKYGYMDIWELVDGICHNLPEWEDPGRSSIPIDIETILKVFGKTAEDISIIREEADQLSYIKMVLG